MGARIGILFSLFIASWLLFSLISYGIAIPVFGLDAADMGNLDDYNVVQAMKFAQSIMTIGAFAAPVFFYRKIRKENMGSLFQKSNFRVDLLLIAALMLITALPLISFLAEWNASWSFPAGLEPVFRSLEDKALEITYGFLKVNTVGELFINLIIIAALPAICEELFFRGAMQQWALMGMNKHLAIWITAIVFSLVHAQAYGFVPRTLLGGLFGYLALWGGNLIYPIVAHFVNNAIMVVLVYYINKEALGSELETFGANDGEHFYVLISLFLVIVTLSFYRLIVLGNTTQIED